MSPWTVEKLPLPRALDAPLAAEIPTVDDRQSEKDVQLWVRDLGCDHLTGGGKYCVNRRAEPRPAALRRSGAAKAQQEALGDARPRAGRRDRGATRIGAGRRLTTRIL